MGSYGGNVMPQPQVREVTLYADIGEVRMEVQTANCNWLLADVWVLLALAPDDSWGNDTRGSLGEREKQKQP